MTTLPPVIRIAAAVILDADGRTLVVRKRGTSAFMQPGGKIMAGESAVDALHREVAEELGVEVAPSSVGPSGAMSPTPPTSLDTPWMPTFSR